MKRETLLSDIKNMDSVFAGIMYASNNVNPIEKYFNDAEFMIGYTIASRLQEKQPTLIKKPTRGRKSSRKCK